MGVIGAAVASVIVAPPMGNIATMATANVMNGTPILTAPKAAEPKDIKVRNY